MNELVIKRIVEETPWHEDSTRAILLISDANPHPLGYTYKDFVVGNQIDWRKEAEKAAQMKIQIDTVTITDAPWYKELSRMTNGISVPFSSGHKTGRLVEASIMARGSIKSRMMFDCMYKKISDPELKGIFDSYKSEREKI